MRIDLTIPTRWEELTTEQLRETVEVTTENLRREEVLLVLLCKFANVKMQCGMRNDECGMAFETADGKRFTLEVWQVADFCNRLQWALDEDIPIEAHWPFGWDAYLMNTTFGDWFHADALMLGYSLRGDITCIRGAMKDLDHQDHDGLQHTDPDLILLLKWYDLFKEWLQERYPLVFKKKDSSTGSEDYSPIDARQNIMLMLTDGKPQDNEAIEKSNVHDVLAALQHKIEEAKHIEEQMSKYKH